MLVPFCEGPEYRREASHTWVIILASPFTAVRP